MHAECIGQIQYSTESGCNVNTRVPVRTPRFGDRDESNTMKVLIFTQSYPFDYHAEHIFISREIPYIAKQFDNIVSIPRLIQGQKLSVPPTVEVEEGYASYLTKYSHPVNWLKLAFASRDFYRELYERPAILLYPSKLLMLILFVARAELTRQLVSD